MRLRYRKVKTVHENQANSIPSKSQRATIWEHKMISNSKSKTECEYLVTVIVEIIIYVQLYYILTVYIFNYIFL